MNTPTCPHCNQPTELRNPTTGERVCAHCQCGAAPVPVTGLGDLRHWRPAAALPEPVAYVSPAVWGPVADQLINAGWSFGVTRYIEGPPGTTDGAGYLVVAFARETRIEVACAAGEQGAAVMACVKICRATPPGVKGTD